MRSLSYNDLSADRNTVAVVQALEAILEQQVKGHGGSRVEVNHPREGLWLSLPGQKEAVNLYPKKV
jgi:hypothetical protein